MFRNYLKSIGRSFVKNKWFAGLNLVGLSLAFTAFILICIYLHHETNYEGFHQKADRIYRLTYYTQQGDNFKNHWARVPGTWINDLQEEVPEVESLVRLQNKNRKYVQIDEKIFKPEYAYTADQGVFQVFNFKLIQGDPNTALAAPNSVVLTEKLAKTYFSDKAVLGQTIEIRTDENQEASSFEVTGIMEDLPSNTHLPVDLLLSYNSPQERQGWAYVYTLFKDGVEPELVFDKITAFVDSKIKGENDIAESGIEVQALPDIHLQSQLAREIKANGNAIYIKIFGLAAIFIMLIAFINFINLNSAISVGRSKEFGVRKVMGARKTHHLMYAFIESVSYSLLALSIAGVLSIILFPKLQQLTGFDLTIPLFPFVGFLLLLGLLGGLLAGIYPAFVINQIDLQRVLKSAKVIHTSVRSVNVKRLLVSIQFGAAILLVGSALAAYSQIKFIQKQNLSLAQNQVLAIPAVPMSVTANYRSFKEKTKNLAGVSQVAACMQVPSDEIRDSGPVLVKGVNSDPAAAPFMDIQIIDDNFIDLMKIELLEGSIPQEKFQAKAIPELNGDFNLVDYLNKQERSYLINETAMHQLGWNSPAEAIGQEINWSIGPFSLAMGEVTAVVKDYHQETLKNEIDPLVLTFESLWLQTFLIKINNQDIPQTVQAITDVWQAEFPDYPMEYYFMDQLFDQLYAAENGQVKLLSIFGILAILIAAIGLFSLIAFNLRTRLKELAIRQVLGANFLALARMIGKEYFWTILLSAIVAVPLSYWAVQIWLENFAYQVELSFLVYLWTLLLLLITACGIIASQTYWSTRRNLTGFLKE